MAQFYTFADSIGGSGAQLQNLYQNRELADQRLLAQQIQAGRDRQAQANWEAQMRERSALAAQGLGQRSEELAQRRMEREGDIAYRNRTLNLSKEYQDWLMKQPRKDDLTAAREVLRMKAAGLEDLVDRRLPINWDDFADVPEAIVNPLRQADTALRQQEVAALKAAQDAALAGRRLNIINQRAAELEKAESPSRNPLLGLFGAIGQGTVAGTASVTGQTFPQDMAKMMRERVEPFDTRFKELEKTGLISKDVTGEYSPNPELTKPWMAAESRRLNMTATVAPPVAAAPVAPRPINIAVPPTAMTGTNRPPIVRQNGIVFRLMPDGSYQAAQ